MKKLFFAVGAVGMLFTHAWLLSDAKETLKAGQDTAKAMFQAATKNARHFVVCTGSSGDWDKPVPINCFQQCPKSGWTGRATIHNRGGDIMNDKKGIECHCKDGSSELKRAEANPFHPTSYFMCKRWSGEVQHVVDPSKDKKETLNVDVGTGALETREKDIKN